MTPEPDRDGVLAEEKGDDASTCRGSVARSETSHESRIGHKAELTCIIESFAVRGCCCFRVGTADVAVIVGVAIDICRNGFAGDVRIGGELAARVFYVKRELVDFVVVDAFDDILHGKFSQLSGLRPDAGWSKPTISPPFGQFGP